MWSFLVAFSITYVSFHSDKVFRNQNVWRSYIETAFNVCRCKYTMYLVLICSNDAIKLPSLLGPDPSAIAIHISILKHVASYSLAVEWSPFSTCTSLGEWNAWMIRIPSISSYLCFLLFLCTFWYSNYFNIVPRWVVKKVFYLVISLCSIYERMRDALITKNFIKINSSDMIWSDKQNYYKINITQYIKSYQFVNFFYD